MVRLIPAPNRTHSSRRRPGQLRGAATPGLSRALCSSTDLAQRQPPQHANQTGRRREAWALARARGPRVSTGYFEENAGDVIFFNYMGIILTRVNYLLKTIGQTSRCSCGASCPHKSLCPTWLPLDASLSSAWFFLCTLLIANELNFPRR